MRIRRAVILLLTIASAVEATSQLVLPQQEMAEVELEPTFAPVAESKQDASQFAILDTITFQMGDGCGTTYRLSGGTELWQLRLRSAGALSMSVLFRDLYLPEGSELWVSDGDCGQMSEVRPEGVSDYTPSDIVAGEEIVISYVGDTADAANVSISHVARGFREIGSRRESNRANKASAGQYGASAYCQVASVCDTIDSYLGRSVCRLLINNTWYGTATLVNNTRQDQDPIVLTSAHVLDALPFRTCVALFGFSEPLCGQEYVNSGTEKISGATIVGYDETSDMAVLRLSASPTIASRPYWAGWTTELSPEGTYKCLHHPYGDSRKVATAATISPNNTYSMAKTQNKKLTFRKQFHWRVAKWTTGVTEAGSSGSPLFDVGGHIIGALTGGAAICNNPKDDYYWELAKAWTLEAYEEGTQSLADILDPLKTGVKTLEGRDFLVSGDKEISVGQTFMAIDSADASAEVKMTKGAYKIAQPISIRDTSVELVCVDLYSKKYFSENVMENGPSIAVKAGMAIETDTTIVSSKLRAFSSDNVVELPLESSCKLRRGTAYIVLEAQNFGANDFYSPMTVPASEGESVLVYDGSEWRRVAGRKLMLSYLSVGNTVSSINEVRDGKVIVSSYRGGIEVRGESISRVRIWDRRGQLCLSEKLDNVSVYEQETTDLAQGLYIVRVTTAGGTSTFKVVVR
ncbi:MAG: trypsin-like peptidase domain-containing protein [Bacteroidales bacterium]|nr:trypsin-like peptidase domain-containing protein [Bacteroidales bacterium]